MTDAIAAEVTAWESRPLEPMYPVVFFDALRETIRDEAAVHSKTVYLALAMLPGAAARFWASGSSRPKVLAARDSVLGISPEIRRVIYTTNALESVHARFRKIIKTRGHFPHDDAATKLIWLALRNINATWGEAANYWHFGDESIRDPVRGWQNRTARGFRQPTRVIVSGKEDEERHNHLSHTGNS